MTNPMGPSWCMRCWSVVRRPFWAAPARFSETFWASGCSGFPRDRDERLREEQTSTVNDALTAAGLTRALRAALRPGLTVALGDGVGVLRVLGDGRSGGGVLSEVAREIGSVTLILGWLPAPLDGLDPDAFAEVIALMPGWGVRDVLRSPKARFLPTRLAAIPALLADVLRPQVLLTR